MAMSPPIRICCELSEILSTPPDVRCTTEGASTEDPVTMELLNLTESWSSIWTGFPVCPNVYNNEYEFRSSARPFTVTSSGALQLAGPGAATFDGGEFCLHKTLAQAPERENEHAYLFVALTCPKKDWQSIFQTLLLFNSIVFLVLALVHHVKNRRTLHTNLHNWMQCAYLLLTLTAFGCLATFGVLKAFGFQISAEACIWLGHALEFSFISAFMWITCINLDLWYVFACKKGLTPQAAMTASAYSSDCDCGLGGSSPADTGHTDPRTPRRVLKDNGSRGRFGVAKKTLLFTFVGGLGLPILFTWQKQHFEFTIRTFFSKNANGTFADTEEDSAVSELDLKTDNESQALACVLISKFPYLYGPICVFLIANLVFYAATLVTISGRCRRPRRGRRNADTQSPSSTNWMNASSENENDNAKYRNTLYLFSKLFALTLILWTLELVNWMLESGPTGFGGKWIHFMVNCVTFSQGVAIFVIYVWKPNMYRKIRGKFKVLASRGVPKPPLGSARLESVNANTSSVGTAPPMA